MNIDKLIELSLEEDIGTGDVTTDYLDLDNKKAIAFVISKQSGVLAGLDIAMKVFRNLDPNLAFVVYKKDGDTVNPGDDIIKITGLIKEILSGERVALNFLQRLSGIATLTRSMAEIVFPYGVKLLDTRKTSPLMREYEKYAVRVGGGHNHRFGLYDMIMLKDNHIQALGSIKAAVNRVRIQNINYKIEVEVKNLKELREALKCAVDRILLDNMSLNNIKKSVEISNKISATGKTKKVELEISGGVNLKNIEKYAQTGVDFISTGAITHSAKALDLTLLFRE